MYNKAKEIFCLKRTTFCMFYALIGLISVCIPYAKTWTVLLIFCHNLFVIIVGFVDIGGIVDNHFKFSFHNTTVGICFPANELFVNKIELQNFICLI
jgi:hypothetical protein